MDGGSRDAGAFSVPCSTTVVGVLTDRTVGHFMEQICPTFVCVIVPTLRNYSTAFVSPYSKTSYGRSTYIIWHILS